MTTHEGQTPQETEQQVNELFDSLELTQAVETEEFRLFLDHIPIAIAISKLRGGDHRIVYANKAYEALIGQACADIRGRGWSVLDSFRLEDQPHLAFGDALRSATISWGVSSASSRNSRSWRPIPASSRMRTLGRSIRSSR